MTPFDELRESEFSGYRRLFVSELERLDRDMTALSKQMEDNHRELSGDIHNMRSKEISDMKVEIALLKMKAGVWGLLGAAIPIAIAIILKIVWK